MREIVLSILRRYIGGQIKQGGGSNVLMKCPFHKGGQERNASFSVNLESGLFHCFTGGCPAGSGDVEKLLRLFQLPSAMIEAELSVVRPELERQRELRKVERQNFHANRDPFQAEHILPEAVLGVFDHEPKFLIDKGFDPALLKAMEVGYDQRLRRVIYPIRDVYGNLAGVVGGATEKEQSPKYLVYKGGTISCGHRSAGHYGEWFNEQFPSYTFENHKYLWNWHRVSKTWMSDPGGRVYIVEGYKAALWLIQNGYPNTVALMGSYVSDMQQRLLHRLGGTAVLCLDNDGPGRRARRKVGEVLWGPLGGRILSVTYPPVDDDTQPDDYPPEQLRPLLGSARPVIEAITGLPVGPFQVPQSGH